MTINERMQEITEGSDELKDMIFEQADAINKVAANAYKTGFEAGYEQAQRDLGIKAKTNENS